jgi:exopolysaccharide production protein ExoZ
MDRAIWSVDCELSGEAVSLQLRAAGEAGPVRRFGALDQLRGLMALAVAAYHFSVWTHALAGRWRTAAIVLGVYSVQGFFIISGFCFFRLYAATQFDLVELQRFYVRRFLRIAPLFYLAVVASFALGKAVTPQPSWQRVLENVTLSFGLFHPNHALVLGGWSIGIEYVFYLSFPALTWLSRQRGALPVLLLAAGACALPYTFGRVSAAIGGTAQFNAYVQVRNHGFLFLLGAVIAEAHAHSRRRIPALLALLGIVGTWWFALALQSEPKEHVEVMVGLTRVKYVCLCGLTVALAAFARFEVGPGKGWSPLRELGQLSYAVYLIHPFAWLITTHLARDGLSPLAQLGLGLAITLVISACAWRTIERPAIALGRRWSERISRAPVPLKADPGAAARPT